MNDEDFLLQDITGELPVYDAEWREIIVDTFDRTVGLYWPDPTSLASRKQLRVYLKAMLDSGEPESFRRHHRNDAVKILSILRHRSSPLSLRPSRRAEALKLLHGMLSPTNLRASLAQLSELIADVTQCMNTSEPAWMPWELPSVGPGSRRSMALAMICAVQHRFAPDDSDRDDFAAARDVFCHLADEDRRKAQARFAASRLGGTFPMPSSAPELRMVRDMVLPFAGVPSPHDDLSARLRSAYTLRTNADEVANSLVTTAIRVSVGVLWAGDAAESAVMKAALCATDTRGTADDRGASQDHFNSLLAERIAALVDSPVGPATESRLRTLGALASLVLCQNAESAREDAVSLLDALNDRDGVPEVSIAVAAMRAATRRADAALGTNVFPWVDNLLAHVAAAVVTGVVIPQESDAVRAETRRVLCTTPAPQVDLGDGHRFEEIVQTIAGLARPLVKRMEWKGHEAGFARNLSRLAESMDAYVAERHAASDKAPALPDSPAQETPVTDENTPNAAEKFTLCTEYHAKTQDIVETAILVAARRMWGDEPRCRSFIELACKSWDLDRFSDVRRTTQIKFHEWITEETQHLSRSGELSDTMRRVLDAFCDVVLYQGPTSRDDAARLLEAVYHHLGSPAVTAATCALREAVRDVDETIGTSALRWVDKVLACAVATSVVRGFSTLRDEDDVMREVRRALDDRPAALGPLAAFAAAIEREVLKFTNDPPSEDSDLFFAARLGALASTVATATTAAEAPDAVANERDPETQGALDAIADLRAAVIHADGVLGTNVHPWLLGITHFADLAILARDEAAMGHAVEQYNLNAPRHSEPVYDDLPPRFAMALRNTKEHVEWVLDTRCRDRVMLARRLRSIATDVRDSVSAHQNGETPPDATKADATQNALVPGFLATTQCLLADGDARTITSLLGRAYAAVCMVDAARGTRLGHASRDSFCNAIRVVNSATEPYQECVQTVAGAFLRQLADHVHTEPLGRDTYSALRICIRQPGNPAASEYITSAIRSLLDAVPRAAVGTTPVDVAGAIGLVATAARRADETLGTRMAAWTEALMVVVMCSLLEETRGAQREAHDAFHLLTDAPDSPRHNADAFNGFAEVVGVMVSDAQDLVSGYWPKAAGKRRVLVRSLTECAAAMDHIQDIRVVAIGKARPETPLSARSADLDRWLDRLARLGDTWPDRIQVTGEASTEAPLPPAEAAPSASDLATPEKEPMMESNDAKPESVTTADDDDTRMTLESLIANAYAAMRKLDYRYGTNLDEGSRAAFVETLSIVHEADPTKREAQQNAAVRRFRSFRHAIAREAHAARSRGDNEAANAAESMSQIAEALDECMRSPQSHAAIKQLTECVTGLWMAWLVKAAPNEVVTYSTVRDACFALNEAARHSDMMCGTHVAEWTQSLLCVALRSIVPHSDDDLREIRATLTDLIANEPSKSGVHDVLGGSLNPTMGRVRGVLYGRQALAGRALQDFVNGAHSAARSIHAIVGLRTSAGLGLPVLRTTLPSLAPINEWGEAVAILDKPLSGAAATAAVAPEPVADAVPATAAPMPPTALALVRTAASAAQIRVVVRQGQRAAQGVLARALETLAGDGAASRVVRTEAFGALAASLAAVAASKAGADAVAEELGTQALASVGAMLLDTLGGPLAETLAPIVREDYAQEILPGLAAPAQSFGAPWQGEHSPEPQRIYDAPVSDDTDKE